MRSSGEEFSGVTRKLVVARVEAWSVGPVDTARHPQHTPFADHGQ